MGRKGIAILVTGLATALSVVGAITAITAAAALSPVPRPESARVVFNNDKRLVSVKADGSDRRVLTLKNSFVGSIDGLHDTAADGSPDGRQILFLRQDWSEKGERPEGLMVLPADGGKPRMLVATNRRTWIPVATWSRDGSLVYFAWTRYTNESFQVSIRSVRSDGSGLTTLWTSDTGNLQTDEELSVSGIEPAPDGRLLLTFDGDDGQPRLELFDPGSGQLSTLRAGAGRGSYSPDGKRIAFINDRQGWGALNVMNADGTGAMRIAPKVPNVADAKPDWSADGSRIVFQSARDGGVSFEGEEIWTVAPDGDCLSRLTNGTPASMGPVWLGQAFDRFDPGNCGDLAPKPLIETQIPKRIFEVRGKRYWVGPVWDGMLLSETDRIMNGVDFGYADCAYFEYELCPGYRSINTDEVCADRIYPQDFRGMKRLRGAVIMRTGDRSPAYSSVITGGEVVDIQINNSRSFAEQIKVAKRLQPVNGPRLGKLPGPVFARGDIRKAKGTLATWRREGSLKSLGEKKGQRQRARGWLSFARALEKVGPYRTVRCRGFSNAR